MVRRGVVATDCGTVTRRVWWREIELGESSSERRMINVDSRGADEIALSTQLTL